MHYIYIEQVPFCAYCNNVNKFPARCHGLTPGDYLGRSNTSSARQWNRSDSTTAETQSQASLNSRPQHRTSTTICVPWSFCHTIVQLLDRQDGCRYLEAGLFGCGQDGLLQGKPAPYAILQEQDEESHIRARNTPVSYTHLTLPTKRIV